MKANPTHKPGPGRRHGETRELILNAAQQMVQTHSYDGFSFRDLAEAVGIRKASVYHHFETKEALASAMTERAGGRFRDWSVAHAGRPALQRLEAYCFELYGERLGAGHRLCPGGSLVAGWSHLTDGVRGSVRALMDGQLAFLTRAMADGANSGELVLPAGTDPETAAKWFAAAVQGALVCARAIDSRDEFGRLCQITLDTLRAPRP